MEARAATRLRTGVIGRPAPHSLALSVGAARAGVNVNEDARPEAVIRSFVHAMYSNDVAAFEALTLPDRGRDRLERVGS
jgi:hypothetical protein